MSVFSSAKTTKLRLRWLNNVKGGVRLGIEAPKDISIFREKVLERILDKDQE
jgi:carbon storage regulator CsrA